MTELLHDRVEWRLDGGVARFTLARPDAGNALDLAMAEGILEAARRLERGAADAEVRVGVLSATGSAFCVGGDLREFAAADDRGAQIGRVADALHEAIAILGRVEAPIVSVVHATAAGGGIGVALAADVVLVARQAKLRLAYTAAGLSPDCGATWILPRRLGLARALDLALTNRVLTGEEAAAWGLVSRAVDADELSGETERLVAALAAASLPALAATKRLMRGAHEQSREAQMAEESSTIAQLTNRADAREGIDAFLEKRQPVFG